MKILTAEQIRSLTKEEAQALVAGQQRLIAEMDRHICIEEFGEESVEDWEGPSEADVECAKAVEREFRSARSEPVRTTP